MDKIFVKSGRSFAAAPGTRIIRREELQALYAANEILEQGRAEAEAVKKQAEQDYQKRFEQGLAEGREEGRAEYSMKIMEMVMTQVDSLAGLEQQLTEVVISSIEKLIGSFDKDDLAVRIVHKGLSAVRGEKRITVRVSPADEPAVRRELQAFLISEDGSSGYLQVTADPNLKRSDCILETPLGVVNAGLNSQLQILKDVMRERVGEPHAT